MNQPSGKCFANLQALGPTVLATAFYLLLSDAAIETFMSGSPIRWWVVILAAAYLGGSVALWWRGHPLWKHLDGETRITISLFVLLGLMAFSVWLPGGLTQGFKL